MRINLEKTKHGMIWIDTIELTTKKLENGKTALEIIKADIENGTDIGKYAKYRKTLQHHKIINDIEVMEWRTKVSANELPALGMISSS